MAAEPATQTPAVRFQVLYFSQTLGREILAGAFSSREEALAFAFDLARAGYPTRTVVVD